MLLAYPQSQTFFASTLGQGQFRGFPPFLALRPCRRAFALVRPCWTRCRWRLQVAVRAGRRSRFRRIIFEPRTRSSVDSRWLVMMATTKRQRLECVCPLRLPTTHRQLAPVSGPLWGWTIKQINAWIDKMRRYCELPANKGDELNFDASKRVVSSLQPKEVQGGQSPGRTSKGGNSVGDTPAKGGISEEARLLTVAQGRDPNNKKEVERSRKAIRDSLKRQAAEKAQMTQPAQEPPPQPPTTDESETAGKWLQPLVTPPITTAAAYEQARADAVPPHIASTTPPRPHI